MAVFIALVIILLLLALADILFKRKHRFKGKLISVNVVLLSSPKQLSTANLAVIKLDAEDQLSKWGAVTQEYQADSKLSPEVYLPFTVQITIKPGLHFYIVHWECIWSNILVENNSWSEECSFNNYDSATVVVDVEVAKSLGPVIAKNIWQLYDREKDQLSDIDIDDDCATVLTNTVTCNDN